MKNFEKSWLNEENKVWVWNDIAPALVDDEVNLDYWNNVVERYPSGDPGFSETTVKTQAQRFGHSNVVDVRYTFYRSETGELLAFNMSFINEEGYQKPFGLMVHPDHRRKGIGTLMIDFIRERFMNENGVDMDAEIAFVGQEMTQITANFVNKYVNEDYKKRNSPNEV